MFLSLTILTINFTVKAGAPECKATLDNILNQLRQNGETFKENHFWAFKDQTEVKKFKEGANRLGLWAQLPQACNSWPVEQCLGCACNDFSDGACTLNCGCCWEMAAFCPKKLK